MSFFDRFFARNNFEKSGKGLVIVAGMPKSGTTAIARLLGAATGLSVCSDPFHLLDEKKVQFRDQLYAGDLSLSALWIKHKRVFSGQIVKDPNFPHLLSEIVEFLPDAKIVSLVRDPRDNIRSILNRLDLSGKPERNVQHMVNVRGAWRDVLEGHNPEISGRNYIEVLAHRWRLAAEAFKEYRDICYEIRYEDFLKDKVKSIRNLAEALGYYSLNDIDHLIDIQFQPRGNPSVKWIDFFGEENLLMIDEVVGNSLYEYGYEKCKKES